MSLNTKHITINNDFFFQSVEEMLAQGLSVDIKVKGLSMRPFLRNEVDSARLVKVSAEELVRGDVVLFRHHGHHTLHRYYGTREGKLIFKGDGNCRLTELAEPADIVARVVSIMRPDGTVTDYGTKDWQRKSRHSLWCKALRTPIFIAKQIVKKIIRR